MEAEVGSERGEEGCWLNGLKSAFDHCWGYLYGVVGVDVVDQLHACMRC